MELKREQPEHANRRALTAARARHEKRMVEARRLREERLGEARRAREVRMAEARHAHEERVRTARHAAADARRALEARTARAKGVHEERMQAALDADLARLDAMLRRNGGRGRPDARRRGSEEGGEAVPAVPKPRPNPLSGAAAAPID